MGLRLEAPLKIKSVRIKNYRSLADVSVDLGNYTSLVGANGAGKSTVLCALNIFFREAEGSATSVSDLDEEDFHRGDVATPIEITVTFHELSEDAQRDFAEYYRGECLVVTASAVFDEVTRTASVRQFGQRKGIEAFAPLFKLYNDNAKAAEVTAEYERIRVAFPDLPKASTKDACRIALRNYEEAKPELCVLIPSEDQFYGFSRGGNRLAKYVQWVYVPAVKDATKENVETKTTALGKLLARTVRSKVNFGDGIKTLRDEAREKYQALMKAQQGALDSVSKSLTERLGEWAHPEARARVAWSEDPKNSVKIEEPAARLIAGESDFEGELSRFGHGLQRSYLLALLQELASADDSDAPRLILGCEEPELYQHPPQARHLASVLSGLGESNAQIVVTTHSPYFISGRAFESVRMVRRDIVAKQSKVAGVEMATVTARISAVTGEKPIEVTAQIARLQQELQPHLNEMFFTQRVILVEGLEDVAYLTAWMHLSGLWNDYRRSGCHLVPAHGKSCLIEPLVVAELLQIPVFVLFDSDGNKANPGERAKHEKDNREILRLVGGDDTQPFPKDTVWGARYVQWPTNIGDQLKAEVGQTAWDTAFGKASKGLGNPPGSYAKNPILIGDHLALLHAQRVPIPTLDALAQKILDFSKVP